MFRARRPLHLIAAVAIAGACERSSPGPAVVEVAPPIAIATGESDPRPAAVLPATPAVEPPVVSAETQAATAQAADAQALPLEEPPGFGEIQPPLGRPAPETLTVHGLAGFEVVAIHAQPDLSSPRLGYLRFGQRVMVTPRVDDQGKECAKGFHGLADGGFVCVSKGFTVDEAKPPYMYLPPPPPRLDDPIPYDYGAIAKDGTPLWWRMADDEEIALAGQRYDAIVAAAAPAEPEPEPAAKPSNPARPRPSDDSPPADDGVADADDTPPVEPAAPEPRAAELPEVDDRETPEPIELTPEQLAEQRRRKEAAQKRAQERAKAYREQQQALARKAARLPLNSKSPFLEAGFVITLGEKVRDQGHTWWRTTRGAFVQSNRAWRKSTSDFHGGPLPEGAGFPFGFVMEENASASVMSQRGKLEWKRKLEFREFLVFAHEVEIGGRAYLVTADGLHVRSSDLRLAKPATKPEQVRPYERWIDVDLESQLLVAYQGDVPVYATLVSTGKKGTDEESFLTPVGKFRITTKHVSSSMEGNTASDGAYSIQDVPWAMFFDGNYALHGAFWHSKFGARRSHGCVNLGPTDARWLFLWTTPFVPATWHGVSAHEGAPGSMVVIH